MITDYGTPRALKEALPAAHPTRSEESMTQRSKLCRQSVELERATAHTFGNRSEATVPLIGWPLAHHI